MSSFPAARFDSGHFDTTRFDTRGPSHLALAITVGVSSVVSVAHGVVHFVTIAVGVASTVAAPVFHNAYLRTLTVQVSTSVRLGLRASLLHRRPPPTATVSQPAEPAAHIVPPDD